MCTHVDDLLYSFLPEGEQVMKSFLAKFSVGSSDTNNFRYCGKQFERGSDNIIKVDTADNTCDVDPCPCSPLVLASRRCARCILFEWTHM